MGVSRASRIKSWTPDPLHNVLATPSTCFRKPSVQTVKASPPYFRRSRPQAWPALLLPGPTSSSADSDPAVRTGVGQTTPAGPSGVVSLQLCHRPSPQRGLCFSSGSSCEFSPGTKGPVPVGAAVLSPTPQALAKVPSPGVLI